MTDHFGYRFMRSYHVDGPDDLTNRPCLHSGGDPPWHFLAGRIVPRKYPVVATVAGESPPRPAWPDLNATADI